MFSYWSWVENRLILHKLKLFLRWLYNFWLYFSTLCPYCPSFIHLLCLNIKSVGSGRWNILITSFSIYLFVLLFYFIIGLWNKNNILLALNRVIEITCPSVNRLRLMTLSSLLILLLIRIDILKTCIFRKKCKKFTIISQVWR